MMAKAAWETNRAEIEAQEPHPGQPVADHEFHPGIGELVLRL